MMLMGKVQRSNVIKCSLWQKCRDRTSENDAYGKRVEIERRKMMRMGNVQGSIVDKRCLWEMCTDRTSTNDTYAYDRKVNEETEPPRILIKCKAQE